MKKILTLFCSLVAAAMLFAAPQIKFAPMSPAADTKLHPQVLHALTQDLSKRPAPATETIQRAPNRLATTAMVPPAPICLNGEGFLVGPEYDPATKEWYVALEAEGYTFRLCWFGEADTYCGTYVFEDISWDWTWGWYQSADMFYEIYFQDITMTVSEEQIGDCLTQITIYATLIDTNDNEYQLHAVHKAFSPKKTVNSVLDNSTVTMDFGYYVLEGSNDDMSVKLGVISDVIEGEYTKASFDMNQTKIVYNGVEQQMLQANMMVALSELENGALGYNATLHFYNQDTVLHQVQMTVPLPAAKDTIKVACHNLSVDESFVDYGFVMLFASNTDYDIFAMYEDYYAEAGVYDVALTVTDKKTWLDCSSIRGTLTLKETADGWEANIEAYCDDYNWYSIDMNFEVPVPTKTVKVEFENSAKASFRADQLNMIQLIQSADDYEASITIYNTGLGESFNMEKVLMDYTEFYDWTVESSVEIADIKGVLNQRGDTTIINASYIGFNAVQYDVEFWYTVPTPVDTVEIEMPVEFTNSMQDGYYILSSYTPDNSIFISLSPMTDGEVGGTYINDGLFGKFGAEGGRYDFYSGNTFIYVESEWQNYTIEKCELVVSYATNGTVTADAKFIARNGVYYHVKMTSEYNTHLDFDEPDMDVDRTYTTEDQVIIENQIDPNGYIYLSITAADMSDMCAFFFFVEEADDDIVIPVGTYPINLTEEYGTVQANPGVQGNGVFPSFYAQMLEDGSLIVPLWLLVGGTVDVTKDEEGNAHLEVNAVNSYGVPVHIVYDGSPVNTAVENTQSPMTRSQKLLRNGHLIIKNAGAEYNAQGMKL